MDYKEELDAFGAEYKLDPFFESYEVAVIELETMEEFVKLQEEIGYFLIYHDNTILIYDSYIE